VRTPDQIVASLNGDRSSRNIRACLPPADRVHFDKGYRQAKSTEKLGLSPVNDLLARWWYIARMKATGEYEYVPGRPLQDVLAERAAELGVRLDQ
jgi:hypothetical protein